MDGYDVAIVGAGHGGAMAAIGLRQNGFAGSIALIGAEDVPPYERPPLSKEYLARDKPFERILIRPPGYWREKQIELLFGSPATIINPVARSLTLGNGRTVSYSRLVWSAGGTPRRLTCDGAQLSGVHAVRDKADVDRIMAELAAGAHRAVVIGGGYIGLEAAAALTKLGCHVVVIEAQDRILSRVAGADVSRFFEAEHRAHGVELRLATAVDCLNGDGTRVTGVRLHGGEELPCDMVIAGIGIEPAVGPLEDAGAEVGDGAGVAKGVVVDEFCRTSLPHIHAIGDCAVHASPFAGGAQIRLESVQNAHDMAGTVAKDICGKPEPYRATPWFWSSQYDLKLQTVGLSRDHDATIVRGDPAARSFSVIYLKGGRVVALDCINTTKDYVQGRRLVETGARVDAALLADPSTPLRSLATLLA